MTGDPYRPLLWRKRLAARLRGAGVTSLRPLRPSRITARRSGPANLLVLAVDTLRYDHLGLAGYTPATSVHLDRLAAAGICLPQTMNPPSPSRSARTGFVPARPRDRRFWWATR